MNEPKVDQRHREAAKEVVECLIRISDRDDRDFEDAEIILRRLFPLPPDDWMEKATNHLCARMGISTLDNEKTIIDTINKAYRGEL